MVDFETVKIVMVDFELTQKSDLFQVSGPVDLSWAELDFQAQQYTNKERMMARFGYPPYSMKMVGKNFVPSSFTFFFSITQKTCAFLH
jgi:hypothetical protein